MCDRCEELEEEVRQLKAQLYGNHSWEPPPEFGLTRSEAQIVECMMQRDRVCTYEILFEASRTPSTSAMTLDSNIITTVVCKIRSKLRPFGLRIETEWARGYRLTPDTRARLLNWNTDSKRDAA